MSIKKKICFSALALLAIASLTVFASPASAADDPGFATWGVSVDAHLVDKDDIGKDEICDREYSKHYTSKNGSTGKWGSFSDSLECDGEVTMWWGWDVLPQSDGSIDIELWVGSYGGCSLLWCDFDGLFQQKIYRYDDVQPGQKITPKEWKRETNGHRASMTFKVTVHKAVRL